MESSIASPPRREYITLNAIRGVAAICVVLFHGVALVGAIVPRGYLAVDLFFVLSGFVIEHAYGNRLGTSVSVRTFIETRLIRFWPLYVLGLALGSLREGLLIATGNEYSLPISILGLVAFAGLFFIPFPVPQRNGDLFTINVPSWSLFLEIIVNIFYGTAKKFLSTTVISLSIILAAAVFIWLSPSRGIGHIGVTIDSLAPGCVRTYLSFAIGLLIYRLQPRVPAIPAPILMGLVIAALAFPLWGVTYDLIFVLGISPAIVILGASVEPSGRIKPIAIWLGVISFPLYAVHRPILGFAAAIGGRLPVPLWIVGWGTIFALLAISAGLANHYDTPARKRITHWLRARGGRDPAEAAAP